MLQFGNETFYTPEQIAKKLSLSLTTVYNLIKGKDIPAIRVGKGFRIPESELVGQLGRRREPSVPDVVHRFVEGLRKSPIRKKISDCIMFGSHARGTPHPGSDIDLLLITHLLSPTDKTRLLELEEAATREAGYEDELQVMKITTAKWGQYSAHKSNLYRTISKEGISLWRTNHQ